MIGFNSWDDSIADQRYDDMEFAIRQQRKDGMLCFHAGCITVPPEGEHYCDKHCPTKGKEIK